MSYKEKSKNKEATFLVYISMMCCNSHSLRAHAQVNRQRRVKIKSHKQNHSGPSVSEFNFTNKFKKMSHSHNLC